MRKTILVFCTKAGSEDFPTAAPKPTGLGPIGAAYLNIAAIPLAGSSSIVRIESHARLAAGSLTVIVAFAMNF